MTIDTSSIPHRLSLSVGDSWQMDLPSYAGSGNAWSVRCVDGARIAEALIELGPGAPPTPPAGACPGTTPPPTPPRVPEHLQVRALAPGVAHYRLLLARNFGPPAPLVEHELEIEVR